MMMTRRPRQTDRARPSFPAARMHAPWWAGRYDKDSDVIDFRGAHHSSRLPDGVVSGAPLVGCVECGGDAISYVRRQVASVETRGHAFGIFTIDELTFMQLVLVIILHDCWKRNVCLLDVTVSKKAPRPICSCIHISDKPGDAPYRCLDLTVRTWILRNNSSQP